MLYVLFGVLVVCSEFIGECIVLFDLVGYVFVVCE